MKDKIWPPENGGFAVWILILLIVGFIITKIINPYL